MGYLTAKDRPKVCVVGSAAGTMSFSDGSEPLGKGRLWLLDGKKLMVAVNDRSTGKVVRKTYDVDQAQIGGKSGRITLVDGRHVDVKVSGCGCGLGAAGNASILDEPHVVVMVVTPDWVTVTN